MPSVIPLTTLDRLAAWLDVEQDDVRGSARMQLRGIIASVSQQLADVCDMSFGVAERTERHPATPRTRQIFPDQPIQSVTSVKIDQQGTFINSSALAAGSDYVVNLDGQRIDLSVSWPIAPRPAATFEIVYFGGLAWDTISTVYTCTASEAVTPATYTMADGRMLTVTAYAEGLLTFQPVDGNFYEGDRLTLGSAVVTLGAPSKPSIVNDHPQLEMAALMQCAYLWERRKSAGRTSTTLGNGDTSYRGEYGLLDGVEELLTAYKRTRLRAG